MMDLSKLTPAPWDAVKDRRDLFAVYGNDDEMLHRGDYEGDGFFTNPDDAEFIALARNAFDVMMRRGWGVVVHRDPPPSKGVFCWVVLDENDQIIGETSYFCSFTALVEADKWYKENVEK